MKCIFLGSPEFAVASLEALITSHHKVVGVITQPDRPAGRGLKMEPPAVKVLAQKHSLPILQPEKVNSEATYKFIDDLKPEILAVVAYGEFLGSRLLQGIPYRPVNVHPSLLPDLRGAAPMQWAVLKGYKKTGVTTQYMVKEMDAGDLLLQVEASIGEEETSQDLQNRLKVVGGNLLVETLTGLEQGTLQPRPQDHTKATLAPLLSKEQGLLRVFSEPAEKLFHQVRGLFPWPGSYFFHQGKRVKVLKARLSSPSSATGRSPGEFWFEESRMFVAAQPGVLEILSLQPEGKKALLPPEFQSGIKNTPHNFDRESQS